MKRVIVHYEDGHKESFPQLAEAHKALYLSPTTLHSMSRGRSKALMAKLHISQVEIVDSGLQVRPMEGRKAGKRCPVLCVRQDGYQIQAQSTAEAERLTGTTVCVAYYLDDGRWHQGWQYIRGQAPQSRPLPELPREDVDLIYRYTRHYLYNHTRLDRQDYQDVLQAVTASVARAAALGGYTDKRYSYQSWLYLQVKHYAYVHLGTLYRYIYRREDDPCPGWDKEEWLLNQKAKTEDTTMFAWIPVEYKELATMLGQGYTTQEIEDTLHLSARQRRKLQDGLRQWLLDNGYHDKEDKNGDGEQDDAGSSTGQGCED